MLYSDKSLLCLLQERDLQKIAVSCELRRFKRGEFLFKEGQPAESVWLIQEGCVNLMKVTPIKTQAIIFTVLPDEELCGFSAAIAGDAYFASAVAAAPSTAIRVPQSVFRDLMRRHPDFAAKILNVYHTRLREMAEAVSLIPAPVEMRLAHMLLRLKAAFGKQIPITHKELARMIGARSETTIRAFSVFRRQGWVAKSRNRTVILHPEKLRLLLNGAI